MGGDNWRQADKKHIVFLFFWGVVSKGQSQMYSCGGFPFYVGGIIGGKPKNKHCVFFFGGGGWVSNGQSQAETAAAAFAFPYMVLGRQF